jgi:hypothetical protein
VGVVDVGAVVLPDVSSWFINWLNWAAWLLFAVACELAEFCWKRLESWAAGEAADAATDVICIGLPSDGAAFRRGWPPQGNVHVDHRGYVESADERKLKMQNKISVGGHVGGGQADVISPMVPQS